MRRTVTMDCPVATLDGVLVCAQAVVIPTTTSTTLGSMGALQPALVAAMSSGLRREPGMLLVQWFLLQRCLIRLWLLR
jgi:hypothetical protein